jgi:hypothetical protein
MSLDMRKNKIHHLIDIFNGWNVIGNNILISLSARYYYCYASILRYFGDFYLLFVCLFVIDWDGTLDDLFGNALIFVSHQVICQLIRHFIVVLLPLL